MGRPRTAQKGSHRILVVEDDAPVMTFLENLLSDHGYEVIRARNGVEAMVALTAPRTELPHAVLLDIGLPLEGGMSVLSFLRNTLRSGLPVVVLTGRQDPEEESAVRKLGVSAFLRKPANAELLLAALSRALD